jgi:hypothetical protein
MKAMSKKRGNKSINDDLLSRFPAIINEMIVQKIALIEFYINLVSKYQNEPLSTPPLCKFIIRESQ